MGAFAIVGLLSPMARDMGMSPAAAGWVMTTYALAYAVLSPSLVTLTGRIGRRRVLAFGLCLFAVANLASAMAPTPGHLLATRILAAAGAGMVTPVSAAVVAGLAAPDTRASSLAAVFFGLTLAQVVGVPFGAWLAYSFGWRTTFVTVFVLALPFVWLIWTRVPAGITFQPVRLADLRRVLSNPPLMLAILFTATFLGAVYIPFAYLNPLLETGMGLGRDGVTWVLVLYGSGAVIGNLFGGWMADRFGPFRTLCALACAQCVLMIPMSFLPLPMPLFLVAILVWSVGGWSFMAGQQARLVTLAGADTPVALALNAAAIYIGAALGTALGGMVISTLSINALGIAGAIAAVVPVAHILVSRRLSG